MDRLKITYYIVDILRLLLFAIIVIVNFNFTCLHILRGSLGGHVEGQHGELLLVQRAQHQLNHGRFPRPYGAEQENRELVLQEVIRDELVSDCVHCRHDYLVEGCADVILEKWNSIIIRR